MDLWDLLRVVVRRWYVSFPLLIIAAAVALQMSTRVDAEYSAQSSLILVGPTSTGSEAGAADSAFVNPYLSFSSSLATTAQLLQLSMSSGAARRSVAELGLASNYEVTLVSRSPILKVSVETGDPVVAVETLDEVARLIEDELDERQDAIDAPANKRITVSRLSEGEVPVAQLGSQNRVRIIFAGVGIAAAVAAAFLFEGAATVLNRRGAARSAAEGAEAAKQEPAAVVPRTDDDTSVVTAEEVNADNASGSAQEGADDTSDAARAGADDHGASLAEPRPAAEGEDPVAPKEPLRK